MAKRTLEVKIVGDAASLQRALGKSEVAAGKFGKSMGGAAKSALKFAAVGAGVAGVGVAFSKVASQTIDFDKSMRNVNSLAQMSEKDLKGLEKGVLSLAGKTAQAPVTLANGLYDLVSSGFDAKQSMLILKSSAKAATAGLTTTEVSTKAVAAVLNAYHQPASKAAEISDVLFQTVNKGVISFEQLSTTIGDVLPFASSLGVSLKEVGASTATLTKAGISPEETMTRIKNVMVTLLKPGDALQASFKKLGVSSGEALIKQKGFQGALEALVSTTDGSKASLAQLFPNIRSLGGALALTGKNARGADGDLKSFRDVTGATDKALSQQSKSIAFQWNKVKAVFSSLAIQVGSALIPIVTRALTAFGGFVKQMKDGEGAGGRVRDAFERVKTVLVGTYGAIRDTVKGFKDGKTWAVALVAAIAGFAAATAVIRTIAAVTRAWAAAQVALDAAMAANPIVVATAAIVGIGVALVIAYKKSETFRKIVAGALNIVVGVVDKLAGAVSTLFRGLSHAPGMGWAKKAADVIDHAREAVRGFSDSLNAIPRDVTVNLHVTGKDALNNIKAPTATSGKGLKASDILGGGARKTRAVIRGGVDAILFPLDDAIRTLTAKSDDMQAAFDAADKASERAALVAAKRRAGGAKAIIAEIDRLQQRKRDLPSKGSAGERKKLTDEIAHLQKQKRNTHSSGNLAEATKALRDFDRETARSRKLGVVTAQIAATQQTKAWKDSLADIKARLKDTVQTAADNWRAAKEAAIDAADASSRAAIEADRAAGHAAVEADPRNAEIAGIDAQDKSDDRTRTLKGLDKDIADAEYLVAHSSGKVHAQALEDLKTARDAKERFLRDEHRDQLQAEIDAAHKEVDATADVRIAGLDKQTADAKAALDQQTSDYQAGLQAQLDALNDNLESRRVSYADWAKSVNAILSGAGLSVATSPEEEATVNTGYGAFRRPPSKRPPKKHAAGGVLARVGELGPEDIYLDHTGSIRVRQASETAQGGGGGVVVNYNGPVTIGSQKAARVKANQLAHRLRFG